MFHVEPDKLAISLTNLLNGWTQSIVAMSKVKSCETGVQSRSQSEVVAKHASPEVEGTYGQTIRSPSF